MLDSLLYHKPLTMHQRRGCELSASDALNARRVAQSSNIAAALVDHKPLSTRRSFHEGGYDASVTQGLWMEKRLLGFVFTDRRHAVFTGRDQAPYAMGIWAADRYPEGKTHNQVNHTYAP